CPPPLNATVNSLGAIVLLMAGVLLVLLQEKKIVGDIIQTAINIFTDHLPYVKLLQLFMAGFIYKPLVMGCITEVSRNLPKRKQYVRVARLCTQKSISWSITLIKEGILGETGHPEVMSRHPP